MVEKVETNKVTLIDKRNASVVDSEGRTIKVRMLGPTDRMRLFLAAGPEASLNDRWMLYCVLASSVIDIDGTNHALPTHQSEIEIMADRLAEHGIAAVAKALAALTPVEGGLATAAEGF